MNYVPLYVKTNNSLLTSMIKVDDLVKKAKKLNLEALAICDTNMYGVMDFYNSCLENNIKPIIGLEVIVDNLPVLLYSENYQGYQNLIKLTTNATTQSFEVVDLNNYNNDLLCILPYHSKSLYDSLSKIFPKIYLGYNNADEKKELPENKRIYLNEVLYLEQEDRGYIDYLYAIKKGVTIEEIKTGYYDNHFKSYQEIKELIGTDTRNHNQIIESCNLEIKLYDNLLPVYDCPPGYDAYEYLKHLCREGLKRIFGNMVDRRYIDRLRYELAIIKDMNYSNYFLVVWDFVKYAKDNGILVGPGRGSAAGSLVSYCLNIIDIDPVKYDLLFERFLNPERSTMPDIDIDFEDSRREEVIKYCISKYGLKKVAPIITFGTMASKQAVRDVGRAMDINNKSIDYLSKLLDSKLNLSDNLNKNNQLRQHLNNDPELKKLYQVAMKLEGIKRHSSVHASGVIMSDINLDEVIPLDKSHDDFYVTGYSMEHLEDFGLLKMDFLALRTLTLIKDVIKSINKDYKKNYTFENIPLNDPKAISIFTNADTVGIFQFESSGMIEFLKNYRPNNIEDIFAAIALFRPGPMKNIDSYIKRKKGFEKIDYFSPQLEPILKNTYGIIVYQEQILQIANIMAGYSLGEADILRRGLSRKDEKILIEEKDKFIKRSVARNYTEPLANKVYELILKFSEYGFPRSHAVAYSMISYKMAYLKAHYPNHFLNGLFNMVIGSEIKTREYIYESRLHNVSILPPDINRSGKNYIVEGNGIRYPLMGIKGLSSITINSILEERSNGQFIDIFDFIKRMYGKNLNKQILEILIESGSLKSFGYNNRTLYDNLDLIINYGELVSSIDEKYALKPEITIKEEYSSKELMEKEFEIYGFYLTKHPVTEHKLKLNNKISIINIQNYFDKYIDVVLIVDRIKEITTKNNDKMCFITGSDELRTLDVVVFPDRYKKYSDIKVGEILNINGKVEKRFDKYQLIASTITKLN